MRLPSGLTDELSSNPQINMVEGEVTEGSIPACTECESFLKPKASDNLVAGLGPLLCVLS